MFFQFIIMLIKNYLEVFFLDEMLTPKKKRKSYAFYFYFFISTICFTLFFNILYPIDNLSTLLSLAIIGGLSVFYNDKVYKKLICFFILIVLIMVSELISGIILMDIGITVIQFETNYFLSSAQTLLTSFIMFLSTITIKLIRKKQTNIKINFLFIIYPLLSSITLYIYYLILINKYQESINNILSILMVFFILISNILIIPIIKNITKIELDKQNLSFEKELIQMSKRHTNDLLSLDVKTKCIRHDLKAGLLHISGLLKTEKYEECKILLDNLLGTVADLNNIINTGNIGIDTVISAKIEVAKSKNINISPTIAIPDLNTIAIDEFDVSLISANILDNAIEANEYCPKENRYIEFQLSYDFQLQNICISSSNPTISKKMPKITSKRNKNTHGLGLQNVKNISEKWKGNLNYDIKNGTFYIVITLHNCKEE